MNIDLESYFKGIKGPKNALTDVPGIQVGHVTISDGPIQTGVTAILPHSGNVFKEKVVAASHVINGFGKSIGLIQVEELGTLETPIILTNTFGVGRASTGLVKYMLSQNPDIGRSTGTVNPVVFECNDGYINDIRELIIEENHVLEAISNASEDFEQGAVGAGRGMCAFGLKGGIGSSSRIVNLSEEIYTLGVLVLANFGVLKTLNLGGRAIGEEILKRIEAETVSKAKPEDERGSIIIIIGTDVPLSDRQLKRIAKRVPAGMSKTGSYFGNGSGDIVLAFSTANQVKHYPEQAIATVKQMNEAYIDTVFEAVIQATEESIYQALMNAETTIGRNERVVKSLKAYLE